MDHDPVSSRFPTPIALVLLLFGAVLGGACGNSGVSGPPAQGGSLSISASATSLSVARNANGGVTLTIARSGGFSGAVNLAASGLPTGVTAVFAPAQIPAGQTSSTLTFSPGAAAALGAAAVTITASAAGVSNQTVAVQLTVTAPPLAGPFSLSLSVSSFLALPPDILTNSPTLTITRNAGFAGNVALTVSGAPPGLVVAMTPNNTAAGTAQVVIINGGAANGVYNVTLRGVAAGGLGEQSLTFPITVASPTTGAIHWQFCNGPRALQWFLAVRSGTGPWTRPVPTANAQGISYSFDVSQPTATVALVSSDSGGFRTTFYNYTQQELAAVANAECSVYPGISTRTASGTIAGATGEIGFVGMGFWFGSTLGNGPFSLLNLPAGPLDLVAFRSLVVGAANVVTSRSIIRRATNPAAGATLPVVDFSSTESFAVSTATWTFGNTGGQAFGVSQHFVTAGGTVGLLAAVPGIDNAATSRTVYGVPLPQTVQGDLHQVIATMATTAPPRATKQIIAFNRTLVDRTIDFGPALPAPTVSLVAGSPAGRLRIQGTLPAEYNTGVTLDVTQGPTARFATVQATRAFLGSGSSYDVQMLDVTTALGWDTRFALQSGVPATWIVSGGGPALDFFDGRIVFNSTRARWVGAATGFTAPTDGAVYRSARVSGVITP